MAAKLANMERGDNQHAHDCAPSQAVGSRAATQLPKLADLGISKSQSSRWQKPGDNQHNGSSTSLLPPKLSDIRVALAAGRQICPRSDGGLAADGLTTAGPVLGTPTLGIVSRDALRQRRLRKRRARGVAIYPVSVTGEMIDALVYEGYLLERDATDPAKVSKALSKALS
jgi:hypothetical protein